MTLQVQVVKKGLQVLDKGGDLTRWIDSGEGKRLLQQLKDALQVRSHDVFSVGVWGCLD